MTQSVDNTKRPTLKSSETQSVTNVSEDMFTPPPLTPYINTVGQVVSEFVQDNENATKTKRRTKHNLELLSNELKKAFCLVQGALEQEQREKREREKCKRDTNVHEKHVKRNVPHTELRSAHAPDTQQHKPSSQSTKGQHFQTRARKPITLRNIFRGILLSLILVLAVYTYYDANPSMLVKDAAVDTLTYSNMFASDTTPYWYVPTSSTSLLYASVDATMGLYNITNNLPLMEMLTTSVAMMYNGSTPAEANHSDDTIAADVTAPTENETTPVWNTVMRYVTNGFYNKTSVSEHFHGEDIKTAAVTAPTENETTPVWNTVMRYMTNGFYNKTAFIEQSGSEDTTTADEPATLWCAPETTTINSAPATVDTVPISNKIAGAVLKTIMSVFILLFVFLGFLMTTGHLRINTTN